MSIDLKLVRLFAELSEAQLESLRLSSESRLFEPDSTIFKEGDPGDGIYLIADGAVRISVRMPNEQLCQLARLERGDFFGEMGLFEDGVRSAWIKAKTDCKISEISYSKFRELSYTYKITMTFGHINV